MHNIFSPRGADDAGEGQDGGQALLSRLLVTADRALYAAKGTGRDRVVVGDPVAHR